MRDTRQIERARTRRIFGSALLPGNATRFYSYLAGKRRVLTGNIPASSEKIILDLLVLTGNVTGYCALSNGIIPGFKKIGTGNFPAATGTGREMDKIYYW